MYVYANVPRRPIGDGAWLTTHGYVEPPTSGGRVVTVIAYPIPNTVRLGK